MGFNSGFKGLSEDGAQDVIPLTSTVFRGGFIKLSEV
jgi:hypothetical protein